MMKRLLSVATAACALSLTLPFYASATPAQNHRPFALQADALHSPLGDDNTNPLLSWKLDDTRAGAKQTAYRVSVASSAALAASEHPDVWDSGRVASGQSLDVAYAGPELKPETRYYWRVQAWDQHGKAYPASETTWWETGLMGQDHWLGQWIGYEDREQSAIRAAQAEWVTNPEVKGYDRKGETRNELRLGFTPDSEVKKATLYVTGEDTPAAWINGEEVIEAQKQPAWGRPPWRNYRHEDVTGKIHPGANVLAIEITHYDGGRSITPMNAILYTENADGTVKIYKTGTPDWKSSFMATGDWQSASFDDSKWKTPVPYPQAHDAFGGADSLGLPIPTATVAALRHGFAVTKPIASARLYATAMGAYQFSLNGKKVGDQTLSPGWTDYRQRVMYQSYDVTAMLANGKNVIAALLAPGWYSTPLEWVGQGNNYGETPDALRAQLKIVYKDGTSQWVSTDGTWKADVSPIVSAEIYNGETYDARMQQAGWNAPGFSDSKWHEAEVIHPHEPEIEWQSYEPIREERAVHPVAVTHPKPGVTVYDFGQNLAGLPRITMSGRAGATARLRFAELVNPDGTIYIDNLRNAKATDLYTFAKDGAVTYEPTFTFHGFRYMEVTGTTTAPGRDAVEAVVLHTAAPFNVKLSTGSPMVNQLWSNILWGQRSNFVGVPTDCPQRDERLGWSADAQVFWRTASYNMDLEAFSRKYAGDLRGTLGKVGMFGIYAPGTAKVNNGFGPGWSDAGVVVPWTSWIQSGDPTIIKQNWEGMERYLSTIMESNPDYLWTKNTGINFGDWLSPEGPTSNGLIATAYWAYDAKLMSQMAHAVGRTEDEQKYSELYVKIRNAFRKAYVHKNGVVGWNKSSPDSDNALKGSEMVETQTGYSLALHMGLLPEEMRAAAAQRLVDRIVNNHYLIGTGFLGTPYLLEVLSDTGHSDIAYHLLLNTEFPSWGYMVDHGATTMWERWNGDKMLGDPGMNSFNHYAYGAVAEWIYRYAAGVDTSSLDAGFHTIVLHPHFDARLKNLDFTYDSRYGAIQSKWTEGATGVQWSVVIPPNTTAHLEASPSGSATYKLRSGSLPSCEKDADSDSCFYTLAPGSYDFEVSLNDATKDDR
ncbi:family 78 glycoside hydrolase catalytic domain [Silvibacterium acidisoli]|uniref:family 78 glycoside hydrolase catalytic domain n=1 Tax=Acidobacteriaceae bacterium ZG23-2 TaxID=2883246 RepID=UPI00406C3B1B